MYNPINMVIEDEQRLKEKDLREKNKKKRFEARTQIEKEAKERGDAENQKKSEMAMKKISHMRVREELDRGFDIVTNDQLKGGLANMSATNYMKKDDGVWSKLNS